MSLTRVPGGNGGKSDGMEHLSEETSDEAEHPLTMTLLNANLTHC